MRSASDRATILIVDDSPGLVALLTQALGEAGFVTQTAADGDEALLSALNRRPDLVILDIGLPGRDGLVVMREMRAAGLTGPVLLLTGRAGIADRVAGLDAGADDYLAKPFEIDELLARMRALLRRAALSDESRLLRAGGVVLDPHSRVATRNGRSIPLTERECLLLAYMMRNEAQVVTHEAIAAEVWQQKTIDVEATNIVSVYIRYLRRKLEVPGETPLLHTSHGAGYYFRAGKIEK